MAAALLVVALTVVTTPTALAFPAVATVDINIGTGGSTAMWTAGVLGDQLLFGADNGTHGYELWGTTVTNTGAIPVKDVRPGPDTSGPSEFTLFGSYLYFSADDGVHGRELWRTDGTETGTALVKDVYAGADGSFPTYLTRVGASLYFVASDGVHGQEVWMTDGTTNGTVLAADLNISSAGANSDPAYLYAFNGSLWLQANDGASGAELWSISGTTPTLYDLHAGPLSSYPRDFASLGDSSMFFQAYEQTHGTELWRTDGSAAPALFADIAVGNNDSGPTGFTEVNGILYFSARTDAEGNELWSTNGTAASLLVDIAPGSDSSNPEEFTAYGSALYYSAEIASDRELHRWNGTADQLVEEINLSGSSSPYSLVVVGDALYGVASDGPSTGLFRYLESTDSLSFFIAPGTNSFIGCMCSPLLKTLGGRVYAPALNDEMGFEYLYLDEPTYVLPETSREASAWTVVLATAAALFAAAGVILHLRKGANAR